MKRVTTVGCAVAATFLLLSGCGRPAPARPSPSSPTAPPSVVTAPAQTMPVTTSWRCLAKSAAGNAGIFAAGGTDAPCPARSRASAFGGAIRPAAADVARIGKAASDFSPINLAGSVSGSTVTFTWTLAGGGGVVTSFVFLVGSSPGAEDVAYLDTGSAGTRLTVTDVPPGTYYVRAYPADDDYYYPSGKSNEVIVTVGGGARCVRRRGDG